MALKSALSWISNIRKGNGLVIVGGNLKIVSYYGHYNDILKAIEHYDFGSIMIDIYFST